MLADTLLAIGFGTGLSIYFLLVQPALERAVRRRRRARAGLPPRSGDDTTS